MKIEPVSPQLDDWPVDDDGMFAPQLGSHWVVTEHGSAVSGPYETRHAAEGWLEVWSPQLGDLGPLMVVQVVETPR